MTFLSDGAATNQNKDTYVVVRDTGEAISSNCPQPSPGVLLSAHDAHIAQVDSPPQESFELMNESKSQCKSMKTK